MKFWLFYLCCFLVTQNVWAEFFDPMKPPAFALEKFRLEKIKNRAAVNKNITRRPSKDPWVLSSILYSSDRKHAIINNKLVKKGDVIKGAKLVRLRPDSVRLVSKGKIIDLKIYDLKTENDFKSIKKFLNEKKI